MPTSHRSLLFCTCTKVTKKFISMTVNGLRWCLRLICAQCGSKHVQFADPSLRRSRLRSDVVSVSFNHPFGIRFYSLQTCNTNSHNSPRVPQQRAISTGNTTEDLANGSEAREGGQHDRNYKRSLHSLAAQGA